MSDLLTEDQFRRVLPPSVKKSVNPVLISGINRILGDPQFQENYRDNLLSYTSVMKDGKFKIHQYVDAVRYVSCKLLGSSNIEAYVKSFPDRYQRMVDNKTSSKDIASYVTAYNKTKLVNLIFEQTLIPFHVLNSDMYQRALNTQAELMRDAKSEKVRTDAANSILNHLKAPETRKIELDIGLREDKSIDELRATTLELVAQQRKMLEANIINAKGIAESKLLISEEGDIIDE
jgi:hypothetical protein